MHYDGTKIGYPIVKAQNNDKYLNIRFDGSYGGAGTLFADCSTQDPFQGFITIVYGHHMKDGTMFNNLKYYKSEDFYNEHKVIDLILPDKECSVEVAAFLNVASDSYIYVPEISTEEDK